MMRLAAWLGYKLGEAVWHLLHVVFDVDPPDFEWLNR